MLTILWMLFLCMTSVLCEQCLVQDDQKLLCKNVDISSLVTPDAEVTVSVQANLCHVPVDISFKVEDVLQEWDWTHTFVNEDEIQEVQGPSTYLLLRVKVQDDGNSTLHVQGQFVVVGEEKPVFLDVAFTVDNSTVCPVYQKQSVSRVKTLLPLIVFIVLCSLIVVTGLSLLIWFQVRRRSRKVPYNGSRPVSSVYSYDEEDYIDKSAAAAAAKKKKSRAVKTSTSVIRNSIHRESLLLDDTTDVSIATAATTAEPTRYVSYTTQDDVKYCSLPRHFGGQTSWPIDQSDCPENYATYTLPRRVSESPDFNARSRQIPTKEYLGIDSGSSRPHYSATLFQSFRGGGGGPKGKKARVQAPANAQTHLLDANYASSPSNTPSPQGSCSQVNHPKTGGRGRGHRKSTNQNRAAEEAAAAKRLSSVRLLHDHDGIGEEDGFQGDGATDREPLSSGRY